MSQPTANTKAVAKAPTNTLTTLMGMLEKHKDQIAMALPRHMTPERMIRVALTAVSTNNMLMKCTPNSIAGAIVQSSILGLEPSSVLGESYLVPFFNKHLVIDGQTKKGGYEAQLIPGYRGLIKLARNSGQMSVVDAQVVHENDEWEFEKGSNIYWRHKWARRGPRGNWDGVWAGYCLKDGGKNFEYWTVEQIEEHRDEFSKGAFEMEWNESAHQKEYVRDADGNRVLTGAWLSSPEWMYKKTVLKQALKLAPSDVNLATALALDEMGDGGLPQTMDVLPQDMQQDPEGNRPPGESDPEPKRRSDSPKGTTKPAAAASTAPASGASTPAPTPDVPLDAPTPQTTKTAEADADPKKSKPKPLTLSSIKELKAEIGEKVWWSCMGEASFEKLEDIPTEAIARVLLGVMRGHVK